MNARHFNLISRLVPSGKLNQVDAGYALGDKEIGLVFGHIYQINPHDVLGGNECFFIADVS